MITITIDQIMDARANCLQRLERKVEKSLKANKKAILEAGRTEASPETIDELFDDYDDNKYRQSELSKMSEYESTRAVRDKFKTVLALFNRMSWELKNEFTDAEVTDDHISFKLPASLSFTLKTLADRYGLTAGMFGFESSFTTHDVYIKGTDYEFKAGYEKNDHSRMIIAFGLNDVIDSYNTATNQFILGRNNS